MKLNLPIAVGNSKWVTTEIRREGMPIFAVVEVVDQVPHIRATFLSEAGAVSSMVGKVKAAQTRLPPKVIRGVVIED